MLFIGSGKRNSGPNCHRASAGMLMGLWLSWLMALPSQGAAKPDGPALRAYAQESQHRQAYGVYVNQRKLGWAIDEVKLGQYSGREAAIQSFEVHWRYTSGGETSTCDSRTVNYFALEGQGEIFFGEEEVTEDSTVTHRTAVRENSHMTITSRSQGVESKRTVPLPKETLAHAREFDHWLQKGPLKGSRFVDYSTEWGEEQIDQEEIVTLRGKHTILWGGVKTLVFDVTMASGGALTEAEITADGTMIKGHMSGIFEMRAEKEAVAKQRTTEMVDLLQASSIPVDKDLGDPEKVGSLTLEITGLEQLELPSSHRQRIRWHRGNTTIVELTKDSRTRRAVRLSGEERARYLAPTPAMQTDHAQIRDLAAQTTGGATNVLDRATRLMHWVFANVRQTMAANAATALDVLKNRAGDCTELTLLYVTLARANGIPAREINGVMYVSAGQPVFGWHAWAEIYDGHQWVSVDPTWDELYVDATHLKVSEESNDWRWVNMLGKVKFRVIKFSRDT